MFANPPAAAPHVRSGKLAAVAVTSRNPSPLAPGLPTVSASLPGYESVTIFAVFAPVRTPERIVEVLNREMVQVLKRSDVTERIFTAGAESVGSSPQELAAAVTSEIARMSKVIRGAGIRPY